jgi:hypothetical protein
MDSVNNRSLFRRKSQAARDKVRQMGRVQEPQGILASFQELMNVAGRDRTQNLMPRMMQQPARFQEGGAVAPQAPSLMERFAGTMALPIGQGVDIAATPTPRAPVEVPDISTMVRSNLGDNPEAQEKFTQLEGALTNPDTSAEDRQKAITDAAGVENTKDGLRSVVSQITGREQPASATVDELNRAITGVALGGAIGGPRSVAARISEALLVGLQAQRETAMGRERFGQELAVAQARAKPDKVKGFLETPRGEAAVELYQNFLQNQNMTPDAAYARMDQISPGLGAELKVAMSGGATAPATAPAPAAAPTRTPEEVAQILQQAREAIAQERDRGAVEQMLIDMGVDPAGL